MVRQQQPKTIVTKKAAIATKAKGKRKKGKHLNKWDAHLAQYRQEHPGMKLKECMQNASKTYSK